MKGKIRNIEEKIYLTSETRAIEVQYRWIKTQWDFFLHPYLDDTNKTISYFAFDTAEQKKLFEKLVKINGIGHKIALQIATIHLKELQKIIQNIQIEKLTAIKGIGPKTAKRLIVELKNDLTKTDTGHLTKNDEITNQIIKQLRTLWYEKTHIQKIIQNYQKPITLENQKDVIKRLIKQL